MKPRTFEILFKEALKSMKRNGLMTLASISYSGFIPIYARCIPLRCY